MKEKVILSWSGGKDSALALWEILNSGDFEVLALLTTMTRPYDRVSMHGVRRVLLEQQARALGIPLEPVWISKNASNEEYEAGLAAVLHEYRGRGVRRVVFGDLFLEDIRSYREERLAGVGMSGVFPLWGRDTRRLAARMLELGFRAVVACVDPRHLAPSFAGREMDETFLRDLPDGVDPCGENGEFHTFVFAGPLLRNPIDIIVGRVVLRDSFYFCDLLPRKSL